MTAALLPSFIEPLRALFAHPAPAGHPQDLTEPARCPDAMGTVCKMHDCARFLGEAPLVPRDEEADTHFDLIKQRYFPNSWTAIASCERPGLFKRTGRTRLVVVRYCPTCREAAESFLNAPPDNRRLEGPNDSTASPMPESEKMTGTASAKRRGAYILYSPPSGWGNSVEHFQ